MRVPIRKPGKYTHSKPDPHITRERYQELESKLLSLKKNRPRAAEEVKRLAADGDFSENAAYRIAKGRLRGINQRMLEIEDLLKRAIIIEVRNSGIVQLGSVVKVEIAGKQKTFEILGSTETDPARGVISHNSPLGSALMGKRVGDAVKVRFNGKEAVYLILAII